MKQPEMNPPPGEEAAWSVLREERERQDRLDAALAALRAEGEVWTTAPSPPPRLLAACRERRQLRTWRRGAWWATAAAACLAALAWMGPHTAQRFQTVKPASTPAIAAPSARLMEASLTQPASGTFLPLAGALPETGFVVRVNLPAADLASLGIAAPPGAGTVPAEVLMDEDGVPCGIRFLQ
ncbi:MAG: hypothetical protein ACRD2E_01835 [Terriglobales bacterium]